MPPIELILLSLSPLFLVCVAVEFIKARQHYRLVDSANNTVLALLHQGSDALILMALMPGFYWLHQFSLFTIELTPLSLMIGFLLQDFLYYWFHRASHNIHFFWLSHVVHHSSKNMNFTTAFRQSVLYPLTGMWLFWMPMVLLGFSPDLVFAIVAINLAFQFFVHTQTIGNLGWVEHVLNTPTHHRIHHAVNGPYIDKNYGGVLIIWDKLFGTFAAEIKSIEIEYGIVGDAPQENPISANFHQLGVMSRAFIRANGFSEKLQAIIGHPLHESKHESNHKSSSR